MFTVVRLGCCTESALGRTLHHSPSALFVRKSRGGEVISTWLCSETFRLAQRFGENKEKMYMNEHIPCPLCRHDNLPENRFCGYCGASLTSRGQLIRCPEASPAAAVSALPTKLGPTGKAQRWTWQPWRSRWDWVCTDESSMAIGLRFLARYCPAVPTSLARCAARAEAGAVGRGPGCTAPKAA
jgi:Double zinc ribbon